MRDINKELKGAIVSALSKAADSGDIVFIPPVTPESVVELIKEKVQSVYAGGIFSPEELLALSQLISIATKDKRFYDWEMPILIGYKAEEMAELGNRIRAIVSL